MALTRRSFDIQVRVHDKGTTTPGDGTVDFTLGKDRLAKVPTVGGSIIRPLQGRTEDRRVTIEVVDKDGDFTAQLATSGRSDLLNRICEYRVNENAGGWTTIFTGRLTDFIWIGSKPIYRLTLGDELTLLRGRQLLKNADTTSIWPAGIRFPWRGYFVLTGGSPGTAKLIDVDGDFRRFELVTNNWATISPTVGLWLRDDVDENAEVKRTDGESNFSSLKCELAGTPYPAITWDGLDDETFVDRFDDVTIEEGAPYRLWVRAPGYSTTIGSTHGFRLYADGAEPSDAVPLHVGCYEGTLEGEHEWGYATGDLNVFSLVKKFMDAVSMRYDSTALTALINSVHLPLMSWRLTSTPADQWRWIEDEILGPTKVVAFRNAAGEVVLKLARLPTADAGDEHYFNIATAFTFTKSNIVAGGEPTLETTSRDQANKLSLDVAGYRITKVRPGDVGYSTVGAPVPLEDDWPADFIHEVEHKPLVAEYDNLSDMGEHPLEMSGRGFRHLDEGALSFPTLVELFGTQSQRALDFLAHETFELAGDGPIRGRLRALYSTDSSVEEGDWALIDFEEYPDLQTNLRGGGNRLVLILRKTRLPTEIEYEYLDAGPSSSPLTAPTVTIALCVAGSKHCVDVTIGSVPAGATATLEIGYGDPSPDTYERQFTGYAAGVHRVGRNPSGTRVSARVQATAPGRIRSAWSSVDDVVTASLTAPSSPSVAGNPPVLSWTNGEADYPVRLTLDDQACASASRVLYKQLPAGRIQQRLIYLAGATTHCAGVLHYDRYGGVSSEVTAEFTTATDPADVTDIPEILDTTLIEEAGASGRRVRRSVEVNSQTAHVKAYRRKSTTVCATDDKWPTFDGDQASEVSIDYFKATLGPHNNWELVGEGFQSTEYIRDILIPVGADDLEGLRGEYCYDVVGSGTPPAFTSVSRTQVQVGTQCFGTPNLRQIRIDWVPNADVDDALHRAEIFRDRWDDDDFLLVKTENSPETTTTWTDTDLDQVQDLDQPVLRVPYKIKLVRKSDSVVLDVRTLNDNDYFRGNNCRE